MVHFFLEAVWGFEQRDMNLVLFEKHENGILSLNNCLSWGFAANEIHIWMKPICKVKLGIERLVGGRRAPLNEPDILSF